MNIFRLLACGIVLGLAMSGCGRDSADKSVSGHEAEQAELSALAPGNSAEFHSLATTSNIDSSFASAECVNTRSEGSSCASIARAPSNIAEPITTVETRVSESGIPEAAQDLLTEPVSPEDEAIVRDALYTLGEERCTSDSESGVECSAQPEPTEQLQF